MKAKLKPIFSLPDIDRDLKKWESKVSLEIIYALSYLGEEAVNKARRLNSYTDRTGNLRSSLGYAVISDGKSVFEEFNGSGGSVGVSKGKELLNELKTENPKGIILFVFAGMTYAAAVEAKNFDVITGAVPNKSKVTKTINEFIS